MMIDFEPLIRESLRHRAADVKEPEVPHGLRRRARIRQGTTLLTVIGVAVAVVAAGVAVADRFASDNRVVGPPSEARLSLLNRAYVTNLYGEGGSTVITAYALGPETDRELWTIDVSGGTASQPSPDGTRLYVTSLRSPGLRVLETETGGVVETEELENPLSARLSPEFSPLSISPDGRWFYALLDDPASGSEPIATYDAIEQRLLNDNVVLHDCGVGGLLPDATRRRLYVLCQRNREVRVVDISASGSAASSESIELPRGADERSDSFGNTRDFSFISYGALAPNGDALYVVLGGGQVYTIDTRTHAVTESGALGLSREEFVPPGKVRLSGDGAEMYVGVNANIDSDDVGAAERIDVFDTSDWARTDTVSTTKPFRAWSLGPGRSTVTILQNDGVVEVLDLSGGKPTLEIEPSREFLGLVEVPLQSAH